MGRKNIRSIDLELTQQEAVDFLLRQTQFEGVKAEDIARFLQSKSFYLQTDLKVDSSLIDIDPNESYPNAAIRKKIPIIIDLNPIEGAPLRAFAGREKIESDLYQYGYLKNVYLGQQTYKFFEEKPAALKSDWPVSISRNDVQQIGSVFAKYGAENPVHLWYFLGVNSAPGLKARACGARIAEDGIEFLIGLSGSDKKVNAFKKKIGKGKLKHVLLLDPSQKCDAPIIDGETLVSAVVSDEHVGKVLEGIASGFGEFFSPSYFSKMREVFPWERVQYQTPEMTNKIASYKARAQRELARQRGLPEADQDLKKIARYERVLSTIEDYFNLPFDQKAFQQYVKPQRGRPKTKTYRPRMPESKRFPEGWRPVLARSDDECDILKQMAQKLGCELPQVQTSGGRKNPVSPSHTGRIQLDSEDFAFELDVIPLNEAFTSHDDELKKRKDYPDQFRPRNFASPEVKRQLQGLIQEIAPEVMVLAGPTLQGPPVVWDDYVLDGNLRVIALRQSPREKLTHYYDMVQAITGYRGLLVRRLMGDQNEALRFVQSARKTAPAKNPILMVGNPKRNKTAVKKVGFLEGLWDGIMGNETIDLAPSRARSKKGKSDEIRYKKKGKEKVPVYPEQGNGLPYGAVPLSELPAVVKNSESFKKSSKMFKERYGALPDYAISVSAPKGVPKVLAGVGQLKQLDYWAADNATNAGDWIHWYHEAGERGDGVNWTRACIVAADPYTGRILLVEPEGSDVKFTNRGIVG